MGWSYRYKADDQLYADDEHGPTVFDPGAPISAGSGNVVSVGIPLLGQIAIWTDATHIAGQTVIPTSAMPALTGDIVVAASTTVASYNNPLPASKGGLPTGGATGQILVKNSGSNYDTSWGTGGGNISNTGTPVSGQLAVWADATHVQGVALLPAANFPAITGDIVIAGGALIAAYNNAVPPAKAGLPLGGSTGQVLSKVDNTNFNTTWINPPATGGNVSNSGAPQGGQIALWTDATHISGVNTLPIASAGTPPGGATGEVLKKTTNASFDYAWAPDISGSGGGTPAGSSGELQYNAAGAFAGVTKTKVVLPGTGTVAAAATGASAGTTLLLAPGTFVENSGVELPDGVHMKGSGREISIITSTLLGTTSPFHGIVAPGNNSVISDLSIIAVSPTGTGNEHINPISRRAGCTKSWTNVTIRNCRLYGLADVIINQGASSDLGNMVFIDTLFEGQNDIFMWQSASTAMCYGCEFRRTSTPTQVAQPCNGVFAGGGTNCLVKVYNSFFTATGTSSATTLLPLASAVTGSRLEVYDFVIDYRGQTVKADTKDISVWTPNGVFVNNVRKADGSTVIVDTDFYGTLTHYQSDNFQFAVIDLPLAPVHGQLAKVTDGAASLAYNATVTGGGSTKYLVYWNGTNWKVLGGGTISGGGSVDLNYVHNQVAPAASWAITHNLAKFPSVSVVDSGLNLIMPDVHYVDNNNLSLSFGASTAGKAYLN